MRIKYNNCKYKNNKIKGVKILGLSNNYKAELVRANITEEEVVEKVGITRQAFYNKKTEKTKFTGEEMRKIKNLINEKLNTNYTIEYLFWGE